MTFEEKNITVSLINFTLILGYSLIRLFQMISTESFNSTNVIRLWVTTIILAIVLTVAVTIATHIITAIIQAIKSGGEEPEIEDLKDERDKLIDLKGTRVAFFVTSVGTFFAMLSFALGQPPLVMFTIMVVVGLIAQICRDLSRLILYRRGF